MKIIVLLNLLLCPLLLQAQAGSLVQPQDQLMDGSFIEPYTNKWKVSVIDSSGFVDTVRIWTDHAQLLNLNGTVYLHRVQELYDASYNYQQTWINLVRHDNLVPKRFALYQKRGGGSVMEFEENKVHIQNNHQADNVSNTTHEVRKILYDWNLYGILLVGLPFAEGAEYRIPFWSQVMQSQDVITAQVGHKEEVESLSGKIYVVNRIMTDKGLVFWLSKSKPYVIQLQLKLANGSMMRWEMF